MKRVEEDDVVRHWLRIERRDEDADKGLTEDEALTSLMHRMPGPSAYIWQYRPAEWYKIDLTEKEFRRLRPVPSPDNHTWDRLCQGGTIMEGAARIREEDDEFLAEDTQINIEKIQRYQKMLAEKPELPALVIAKPRSCDLPRVLDGNHRATALALYLLETGEYQQISAYIGIGHNPVINPLIDRICYALDRLVFGKRGALF